jgi:hypothetical protein
VKITLTKLKELKACSEGVDWFKAQKESDLRPVVDALLAEYHFSWANWLVTRLMDRPHRIRYAIFAAEQALSIFEKKYPKDKRPRNAIEAARKVLENDNDDNRKAAADAASVAYAASAASAAYAAADAASAASAAVYAAYAAVYEAYAAADAASAAVYVADAAASAADAAVYAAYAASHQKMRVKILDYGIELLKEKNISLPNPKEIPMTDRKPEGFIDKRIFTDRKLEGLKKGLEQNGSDIFILPEEWDALLSRLSAAEECLEQSGILKDDCRLGHDGYCRTHFISKTCPVDTWRKACGKAGR